jgi:hypothetical protein
MTSVCLTGHGMRRTTLPESLFGHIIALLAKHEAEHSLTAEIVEELAPRVCSVSASGVPDQPKLGT